jgi:hypothetical protein
LLGYGERNDGSMDEQNGREEMLEKEGKDISE